jgi:hypothetical protein
MSQNLIFQQIMKPIPYQPITSELAASGLLVTIKQAAADEKACESTLKANAKARRLPAYQAHFGAPVMVLPSEVREFLKSRTDIASKYHPKVSPAVPAVGQQPPAADPKKWDGIPFPDDGAQVSPVGDLGIGVHLHSLNHSQPSEVALVASCFIEIGRQLNELITPNSNN